jgi:hypothetical protein
MSPHNRKPGIAPTRITNAGNEPVGTAGPSPSHSP